MKHDFVKSSPRYFRLIMMSGGLLVAALAALVALPAHASEDRQRFGSEGKVPQGLL